LANLPKSVRRWRNNFANIKKPQLGGEGKKGNGGARVVKKAYLTTEIMRKR